MNASDHHLAMLDAAEALADAPADGYGSGFLSYQIRTNFRDLCRLIGKEAARQEVADIINAEFERKSS